jgi:hypothetical protein
MTKWLIIIACIVSLYAEYFVHDWTAWLCWARLAGILIVYALCLNVKRWELNLASTVLLLSMFELLDELRGINTQLFITDIIIDLIAITYLIILRMKWQSFGRK